MPANKTPNFVVINGNRYPIRISVAVWVAVLQIADDPTLLETEKIALQLSLVYRRTPPLVFIKESFDQIRWFMQCGQTGQRQGGSKRTVDFVQDWGYIQAAFFQQYGIDLTPPAWWQFWRKPMDWWQFMDLFQSLTEDTQIVKIMGYRGMNTGKIKDKEMRKIYNDLKKAYALKPAAGGQRELTRAELLDLAIQKQREAKQLKEQGA